MAKKIKDGYVCPRCGKPTVTEVERTEHDFIAVHSIIEVEVKSRYGREPYTMTKSKGCDNVGEWPR